MRKNKKERLYEQLVDILKDQINTKYCPNDKMPSERKMMEEYSLSRNTVRQALDELERSGYIYRWASKGAFVAKQQKNVISQNEKISYCQLTNDERMSMKVTDCSLERVEPKKAKELQIKIDTRLIVVTKVYFNGSLATMVERIYFIDHQFIDNFPQNATELAGKNFIDNIILKDGFSNISIALATIDPNDALIFRVGNKTSCLKIKQQIFNCNGEPIAISIKELYSRKIFLNYQYKI